MMPCVGAARQGHGVSSTAAWDGHARMHRRPHGAAFAITAVCPVPSVATQQVSQEDEQLRERGGRVGGRGGQTPRAGPDI